MPRHSSCQPRHLPTDHQRGTHLHHILERKLGIDKSLLDDAILDPLGSLLRKMTSRRDSQDLEPPGRATKQHRADLVHQKGVDALRLAADDGDEAPAGFEVRRAPGEERLTPGTVDDEVKVLVPTKPVRQEILYRLVSGVVDHLFVHVDDE